VIVLWSLIAYAACMLVMYFRLKHWERIDERERV
jgi:hypothetical protein